MAINFKDRNANRPNRYKVIPDSGNEYYVTLERADEPTEAGTPLNADNLNKLLDKTGDTMTGTLNMAAGSFPTIYFTPNGGVGDSALEGGDRVISMHARDKIGVSTPRRQLAVYAAAARNNIADSVRLIDTAENGDKTYYYLYGEHHKPTAAEIGAVTAGNDRKDIPTGSDLNDETFWSVAAWRATTVAVASSLKNCPVGIAFTLDIIAGTGFHTSVSDNSGYIIQRITTNTGSVYWRRVYAGSNGRVIDDWEHAYSTQDKPTPADIGAAAETHKHAASDITSGALAVARGGTGSTNGATGLKNLLAAGNTVLSSYQYGTALPAAGTKGRLFFKKV